MGVKETGLYYLQSRYYNPKTGRFLNADKYATTGQGILGCNMFSYCNGNPVVRIDSTGEICRAYKTDFASYGGGGAIGLAFPFVWLIDTIGHLVGIDDTREETHNNVLPEVKDYAKTVSEPNEKYVVHHIVAKKAPEAGPAREVLMSVGIDPMTNGLNLAVIPEKKHFYLHTNNYYNYINSRLYGLNGNRTAVEWTLVELQIEIQLYCQTGLKIW